MDLVDGEMAATNVEHGADQIANHVVKKTVAAHAIDEEIAGVARASIPRRGKDGSDRRPRGNVEFRWNFIGWTGVRALCEVGVGRSETLEIVFAFEGAGGHLQRGEIQRTWAAIDVTSEKGWAVGVLENAVFIRLCDRGMSRVKCARRRSRFGYANRWRESAIERAQQIFGWNWGAQ